MKIIVAFFKLVRWPNLIFIALTQMLFYFVVFNAMLQEPEHGPSNLNFLLLVFASICIAAAGYIINDYFDLSIDRFNKPDSVIVDKIIKRRWIILWHWFLSGLGILLSLYIGYKTGNLLIVFFNALSVLLLWFYSTHFKKNLLIGNIIVSALLAWVIIVIYFFAGANFQVWKNANEHFNEPRFFKVTALYAGFAFIISLIREVVKDLEDMRGDAKYNCKTMPIVWGIPATKVYTGVWLIVTICALIVLQLYIFQLGLYWIVLYSFIFLIIPLAILLKKLKQAQSPADYHTISSYLKAIILAGILSMLFFLKL